MTDTPRTDAVYTLPQDRAGSQFATCRTLERENARLRETLEAVREKLISDENHPATRCNRAVILIDLYRAALAK